MTPQQDMAGMLAWLLIILTAMVWAGVWIAKLVRDSRIEDAYPTPEPPEVCQLQRCKRPATHKYDAHPSGQVLYICEAHAAGVTRWIGEGTERPYDQQTDVSEFEGEWKP
jgi:uncharacterized iron-regulated membrane protein